MAGHDVLMVSGTDEHGTPILVAADEEGISARELADRSNRLIVEDLDALESTHWFLDLPALASALGAWLDERESSGTWRPNVIKFSQNLLDDIRPRAMTRDIDWGIPPRPPRCRATASPLRLITVSSRRLPLGFKHAYHPVCSGLALCERPTSHRACLRFWAALRHVQPVPADGGKPGADGERHRRARHPDPGPGGQGGRDAARAPRPLQRGHVPDLRVRQRARQPVRQLRHPARPGGPDQPPVEDQRGNPGVPGDRTVLPRPARVHRGARRLAAVQVGPVAAERAQVLPQPARRPAPAGHHQGS